MRNSIINSLVKNSVVVASFLSHAGCGFVPLLKGDGSKSIDYISLDYMRSKSKDLFDLGIHNEEGARWIKLP